MTKIQERVGREAKTAKNLIYCREQDTTQDIMNRIPYENKENRYLAGVDKDWSINTTKLDYSQNPNACRMQNCLRYGTEWRRRGKMKLEESARKEKENRKLILLREIEATSEDEMIRKRIIQGELVILALVPVVSPIKD
jgi:hypothetical protein